MVGRDVTSARPRQRASARSGLGSRVIVNQVNAALVEDVPQHPDDEDCESYRRTGCFGSAVVVVISTGLGETDGDLIGARG